MLGSFEGKLYFAKSSGGQPPNLGLFLFLSLSLSPSLSLGLGPGLNHNKLAETKTKTKAKAKTKGKTEFMAGCQTKAERAILTQEAGSDPSPKLARGYRGSE